MPSGSTAQSFLADAHIKRVVDAYEATDGIDAFSRFVTVSDVRINDFNLSIPLYVREAETHLKARDVTTVDESLFQWKVHSDRLRKSMTGLLTQLEEFGVEN